jgi:hypothetical protein
MNKLAVIVTFILAILTCNSQPKYNIPDLQLYDLDSNLVSLHALLDDGPVFICVWRRRRGQPSTLNTNFGGPKLDQGLLVAHICLNIGQWGLRRRTGDPAFLMNFTPQLCNPLTSVFFLLL